MTNPPDTSVTERVARAISEAGGASNWEHALECARAAISSMPALEEENARLREALQEYVGVHGVLTEDDRTKLRAALSPRKEDQQPTVTNEGDNCPCRVCREARASLTRKDGSEGVENVAAVIVEWADSFPPFYKRQRPAKVDAALGVLRALKEGASREG